MVVWESPIQWLIPAVSIAVWLAIGRKVIPYSRTTEITWESLLRGGGAEGRETSLRDWGAAGERESFRNGFSARAHGVAAANMYPVRITRAGHWNA